MDRLIGWRSLVASSFSTPEGAPDRLGIDLLACAKIVKAPDGTFSMEFPYATSSAVQWSAREDANKSPELRRLLFWNGSASERMPTASREACRVPFVAANFAYPLSLCDEFAVSHLVGAIKLRRWLAVRSSPELNSALDSFALDLAAALSDAEKNKSSKKAEKKDAVKAGEIACGDLGQAKSAIVRFMGDIADRVSSSLDLIDAFVLSKQTNHMVILDRAHFCSVRMRHECVGPRLDALFARLVRERVLGWFVGEALPRARFERAKAFLADPKSHSLESEEKKCAEILFQLREKASAVCSEMAEEMQRQQSQGGAIHAAVEGFGPASREDVSWFYPDLARDSPVEKSAKAASGSVPSRSEQTREWLGSDERSNRTNGAYASGSTHSLARSFADDFLRPMDLVLAVKSLDPPKRAPMTLAEMDSLSKVPMRSMKDALKNPERLREAMLAARNFALSRSCLARDERDRLIDAVDSLWTLHAKKNPPTADANWSRGLRPDELARRGSNSWFDPKPENVLSSIIGQAGAFETMDSVDKLIESAIEKASESFWKRVDEQVQDHVRDLTVAPVPMQT